MGFLQLIPATELKARYNRVAKQLILSASGETLTFTADISFQRETFLGGLKFALRGWVGPLTGGKNTYTQSQNFSIDLPNRTDPSNTVIIVTANHPEGVTIDIEYFVGEPDLTAHTNKQITSLFKEPFNIDASAKSLGKLATVRVRFEKSFLELIDASITAKEEITWTFNSLQTGNTQIFVDITNPPSDLIETVIYDVRIILPTIIGTGTQPSDGKQVVVTQPTSISTTDDATVNVIHGPGPVIPSWIAFVNIGIEILKKAYPLGVQLLEVDGTPTVPPPVSGILALNRIKIVARVQPAPNAALITAILQSTGWGEFGAIQTSVAPWLGDVEIDWPIKLDLWEAFKIFQAAGYKEELNAVTLRQPLYKDIKEPYYIFSLADGQFIAVGVEDKKVVPFSRGNLGFSE
jgi:hypothetical protein